MVVRKAFRRLFQLPHLSHGEHASADSDAILAMTAKKDEDINVTVLVAWHCHQNSKPQNSKTPRSFEARCLVKYTGGP